MLQSTESQRLGHELANQQQQQIRIKNPQKQTTHIREIRSAEAHSAQRQLTKSETRMQKQTEGALTSLITPFTCLQQRIKCSHWAIQLHTIIKSTTTYYSIPIKSIPGNGIIIKHKSQPSTWVGFYPSYTNILTLRSFPHTRITCILDVPKK